MTTTFVGYQEAVKKAWSRVPLSMRPRAEVAAATKLAEEAGEVAQVVLEIEGWSLKPHHVGRQMQPDEADCERLEHELGDVLFVVARLANNYGINLDKAAWGALERLRQRTSGAEDE